MVCPKCGYNLQPFESECPKCARQQGDSAQPVEPEQAQQPEEQQPAGPPPAGPPPAGPPPQSFEPPAGAPPPAGPPTPRSASEEEEEEKPKATSNMGKGFKVGLILGVVFFVVWAFIDNSFPKQAGDPFGILPGVRANIFYGVGFGLIVGILSSFGRIIFSSLIGLVSGGILFGVIQTAINHAPSNEVTIGVIYGAVLGLIIGLLSAKKS